MPMLNPQDPDVVRERLKHPIRNVAVVGLIDENGEILLVRTRRFPNHWQTIGGGVDSQDASPAHALQRELREETGLELDVTAFSHAITVDYDFGEGKIHFFTYKFDRATPLQMNAKELEGWQWFSLQDALALNAFPAGGKFLRHLAERRAS